MKKNLLVVAIAAVAALGARAEACGRAARVSAAIPADVRGAGAAADAVSKLAAEFARPPRSAAPQVWWQWMNGNVTKSGILADLEAMDAIGIGGAQIFDSGRDGPPGNVTLATEAWYDHVAYACAEAKKRKLEICLVNGGGCSCSGGPWITPENAMKFLEHSETTAVGPCEFNAKLPIAPVNTNGFYRDVCVIASPVPAAECENMEAAGFTLTSPLSSDPKELAQLTDSSNDSAIVIESHTDKPEPKVEFDAGTSGVSKTVGTDGPGTELVFAFNRPFVVRGFTILLREWQYSWNRKGIVRLYSSADGKSWRRECSVDYGMVEDGVTVGEPRLYAIPKPFSARYVKAEVTYGGMNGQGSFCTFWLESRVRMADVKTRSFRTRSVIENSEPIVTPAELTVDPAKVVDLTAKMDASGLLKWSVPAGEWKIFRFGMACNGMSNHTPTDTGFGLECDKLSKRAIDIHYDHYIAKAAARMRTKGGDNGFGFNNVLVDSYEVGTQNWTDGFEREFRRRAGYDLTPFMPAFANLVVGSFDLSERFFRDYRRVIADLFIENYAGRLAERCHADGLRLTVEGYGTGPFDDLEYSAVADVPMAEFWADGEDVRKTKGRENHAIGSARIASSAAHLYGRRVCAAESFTAPSGERGYGRWQDTPRTMKAQGDRVYCAGVNQIVYHRYCHSPFGDAYRPGTSMGPWGVHFERSLTWWNQAKEWIAYQTRVQHLLQEGRYVADALLLAGDDLPNYGYVGSLPPGHASDGCPVSALADLKVERGMIVSPGGTRYRFLDVPASRSIARTTLAQLERLAAEGATLALHGEAPKCDCGLVGGKIDDAGLAGRAARLWNSPRAVRVAADETAGRAEAVAKLKIARDFSSDAGERVDFMHREYGNGVEAYFLAYDGLEPRSVVCSFRVSGKSAELWDPMSGRRYSLRAEERDGRTEATLGFDPAGSWFVVFSPARGKVELPLPPAFAKKPVAATVSPLELTMPVLPVAGAKPTGKTVTTTLAKPTDWAAMDDEEIKYFSGTATYRFSVTCEAAIPSDGRLYLDLGEVRDFAEVTVNGVAYPTLWKLPYRVDVTEAAAKGAKLEVTVRVTNLWPNRMIGDERLPPDCEWGEESFVGGAPLKGLPDWVRDGKPSPSGRHTFTTWHHWKATDKLLSSGILGPIRLLADAEDR